MVEWYDKPLNKICDEHTSGALCFSSGSPCLQEKWTYFWSTEYVEKDNKIIKDIK